MFATVVARIIIDYIGSDIFDKSVINHKWSNETFFRMNLTCLQEIVDHRSITAENVRLCHVIDSSFDEIEYQPNTDVIYSLFCKSERSFGGMSKHDIAYDLSRFTPLSTSDYIKKYPKLVSFKGLCISKYIDVDYILKEHPNDIDNNSLMLNEKVPLDKIYSRVNLNDDKFFGKFYSRSDVPYNTWRQEYRINITSETVSNSTIPIEEIIMKTPEYINYDAWPKIIKNPRCPLDYILNNIRSRVITFESHTNSDLIIRSSIAINPRLSFDIIFDKYSDYIHKSCIWENPSLPFDLVLDKYPDRIKWENLGINPNLPVKLINDTRYRLLFKNSICYNEHIDFSKVDNVSQFHNKLVECNNRNYYKYLVGENLMKCLLSI